MTDRELLELAAKAYADPLVEPDTPNFRRWIGRDESLGCDVFVNWNPLIDDGDRYRLAKRLGISIDFADCCAWKRLPDGGLIQEFWGGDCGDEAHAIVRVAVEIGRQI